MPCPHSHPILHSLTYTLSLLLYTTPQYLISWPASPPPNRFCFPTAATEHWAQRFSISTLDKYYLLKPITLQLLKRILLGNIINNNNSLGPLIIGPSNSPKPLLASGIPNLKFDNIPLNNNRPTYHQSILKSKINTNSSKISLLKTLLSKSSQQRRLPHRTVAYQDYLEQVVVLFYHLFLIINLSCKTS